MKALINEGMSSPVAAPNARHRSSAVVLPHACFSKYARIAARNLSGPIHDSIMVRMAWPLL